MADIDYQHDSFTAPFEHGYISVHPEMAPAAKGISPTGRYIIYCIDPAHGSCHFIIEQDENCEWFCEVLPPIITKDLVGLIAEAIESKK